MHFSRSRMACLLFLLWAGISATAQRVADSRDFWYEGRRYLVCNLGSGGVLALEMENCKPVDPAMARRLRDSAVKLQGHPSAIYDYRDGSYCAWNNCGQPPVTYRPRVRVSLEKTKEPGTTWAGSIPGFDKLLQQEKELVKEWTKQDKKRSVSRRYDEPVFRYDSTHRRIFLVGHAGIASVAEDSLAQGAKQVLGEVPGLRLLRSVSPPFHRYIFLQYVQEGMETRDEKMITRVFDTHTMRLLKLPDADNMTDLRFAFCPSGDYVLAVPEWPAPGFVNFQLWPLVINLREWKREFGSIPVGGGMYENMRFYLHRHLLYAMSHKHDRLWVYDLSINGKVIFKQEQTQ